MWAVDRALFSVHSVNLECLKMVGTVRIRAWMNPAGSMVAYLFCAWQYLDLHVLKVATLPPFRRSGLARRLMALAEKAREDLGDTGRPGKNQRPAALVENPKPLVKLTG